MFLYGRTPNVPNSEDNRNALIDSHLRKVEVVAGLVVRSLPRSTGGRDLKREMTQEGILAMLEAAPRYKEDAGPFWPFVYPRIRGAMLDFLGRECRETFPVERSGVRVSDGETLDDFTPEPSTKMDAECDLAMKIDLDRAMKKLTVQEKRVFRAIREGDGPPQIAGMMRITPQRVRRLRTSGGRRLREALVA